MDGVAAESLLGMRFAAEYRCVRSILQAPDRNIAEGFAGDWEIAVTACAVRLTYRGQFPCPPDELWRWLVDDQRRDAWAGDWGHVQFLSGSWEQPGSEYLWVRHLSGRPVVRRGRLLAARRPYEAHFLLLDSETGANRQQVVRCVLHHAPGGSELHVEMELTLPRTAWLTRWALPLLRAVARAELHRYFGRLSRAVRHRQAT